MITMNINESSQTPQRRNRPAASPLRTEAELRALAEDIVRYCPSLTHLLLAYGAKDKPNPLKGLN